MKKLMAFFSFLSLAGFSSTAVQDDLLEPSLKMNAPCADRKCVALTLDACAGDIDWRILKGLVEHKIPATLFLTEKWLKKNDDGVTFIKQHADLFQVENHGAEHVPPVDKPILVYNIKSAGSPEAVEAEVRGGEKAIRERGFPQPKWYRGATAKYTKSSIQQIRKLGFYIAGFSLNGDEGTTLGKEAAAQRISGAENGDVIISHMNHPKKEAGAGVIEGVLALKSKGYVFLKLSDNQSWQGSDGTVN